MNSQKNRFLKQLFPSTAAIVALLGLLGITSPAKADVTLCPNAADATGGGSNQSVSDVSGPLDGTCGPNSAVKLDIPKETDYARLLFDSGVTGYPAGLTLGNLGGLTANVDFSGATGDQPFYMLAFTDATDSLGQTAAADQILMIEFQTSNLSGNTMAVDPNATQFNLFDNTNEFYLGKGQQDTNTISGWISADPFLSGESLQQIRIGEGLSGGGGSPNSLTVNSLTIASVSTPEPSSVILLLTMLLAVALVARKRIAPVGING